MENKIFVLGIMVLMIGFGIFSGCVAPEDIVSNVYREGYYKGSSFNTRYPTFTIVTDTNKTYTYIVKDTPLSTDAFDDLIVGDWYSFGLNFDICADEYYLNRLVEIIDANGTMIWNINQDSAAENL